MGDAVNKAFRLETASKEVGREIVLGRSTYELLACPSEVAAIFSTHTVHLKGYDEPEEVRALALSELPRVAEALGS
jgi:adenylate cyclase